MRWNGLRTFCQFQFASCTANPTFSRLKLKSGIPFFCSICELRFFQYDIKEKITFLLCKDNANREQNKTNVFVFYAEAPLGLSKDNANREQNKTNVFVFYAEVPLILFKDNANREQKKTNVFVFLCRGAAYLIQR